MTERSEREPPRFPKRFRRGWILGPLLVVGIALLLELIGAAGWRVSNRGVFYLVAMVAAIDIGGLAAGAASAGLALALGAFLFSTPGRRFSYGGAGLEDLITLLVGVPIVLVIVGAMKRREGRRTRAAARSELLEQYRDMVEELDAIVWERDPKTHRVSFVSRRAETLLGYSLDLWLQQPKFWVERIHDDDRDRVLAECREAAERGGDRVIEYRVLTANREVVWLREAMRVLPDGRGRRRIRSVVMDITERKRAERILRESERKYRLLMEQASDGILITDHDANFVDVNPRGCEILGYTHEELMERNIRDLFSPEDLERLPLRLEELRAGLPVLVERWVLRKDGGQVPVEISAKRLDDTRLVGIYRDISERKRSESELRNAFSLLEATLESTNDGILVVDRSGKIASYNRRFVDLWGIPADIVATRDDNRALSFVLDQLKDPRGFITKVRDLYATPEAESFDVLEFRDGRVFERYSKPQLIGGESVGRVWSFRDVTERRRSEQALRHSEEQLRHAQKMEAIGRLAGGVAHDFNNLLTAILGNASLVLERLPAGAAERNPVLEIQKAADRAAGLTRQLLAFSRKQVLEMKVLDMNAVVADMHGLLERLIGEHIQLALVPAADLGRVKVDEGQIEQVILNLVVNARDAMPQGGKLVIETANVEVDAALADAHDTLQPGRYVMLAVSDTGLGMDAETQTHIFEPFFTTKARGKGTGLGLSTVYGIVRQCDGHIWVYSTPDRGSTLKIYLPAVEAVDETPEPAPPLAEALGGAETVMLVEDEAQVRILVRNTLAQAGYQVLEAEDGARAIELSERHQGPLQLLVTDVVMPGMSGRDLAERLLLRRPELRVLYISGYTDEALGERGVLTAGAGFLQKPFTLQGLVRKVRDTLDAATPSPAEDRAGA